MSRRKRPLHDSDPNANSGPLKKTLKAEPVPAEQPRPNYNLLLKPDLQKECTARGLIKSGNKSDLIARLESADQARRDKYAHGKNAPYSKEEVAKRPIGAKVPPSKHRADFGKNDPHEKILRRGPSGPPIYDEMGFEIDYEKVAKSSRARPGCRSMSGEKYLEMLEREDREEKRMAQIMGTDRNKTSAVTLMAWTDRISRDLGIPYHTVNIEDYEEWHRRGFKADGAEFEAKNMTEEEMDRITGLATGSDLRK
ncbi:hypothetical protein GP486_004137 [Trichoglossum hirsutum]|uniref:SAP domain-containing protein n=1 Tax=Trichoglossum hirsutum TaxID=265104 RepID=A0A9P8RPM6_9PEZI|nr:hypothetical protein GP486_004137 [Trichoglossum hirsutum]